MGRRLGRRRAGARDLQLMETPMPEGPPEGPVGRTALLWVRKGRRRGTGGPVTKPPTVILSGHNHREAWTVGQPTGFKVRLDPLWHLRLVLPPTGAGVTSSPHAGRR